MSWKGVVRKFWGVPLGVSSAAAQPVTTDLHPAAATPEPHTDVGALYSQASAPAVSLTHHELSRTPLPQGRTSARVRSWRRRVLQRRGARLHVAMGLNAEDAEDSFLAMVDEAGIVVSWYGRAGGRDLAADHVLDRHISQFYVGADLASKQPSDDLRKARNEGRTTRVGWRRRPDGVVFWGATLIDAIVLRDGRLQGYAYVIRRAEGPPARAPLAPTSEERDQQSGTRPSSAPETASPSTAQRRHVLGLALIVLAASSVLHAGPAPDAPPANAVASRYGAGWQCMNGFQRTADACVRVAVPPNAYLDASGSGWKCDRGYIAVSGKCAAIEAPAHAYLDDAYGAGWRCERGYRETRGACEAILIPANAYATDSSYGEGWKCDRGFQLADDACVPVVVPANAFLTRSGDDWKCERGFEKGSAACVAVVLPENAHLDYAGDSWRCNPGFHRHAAGCAADAD